MESAGGGLVAGKLAIFAERDGVEPVEVRIEAVFGEIFVPEDLKGRAERFGFCPSGGFDSKEVDCDSVIVARDKIVAEFVKESEGEGVVGVFLMLVGEGVIDCRGGMEAEDVVFGGAKGDFWVGGTEGLEEGGWRRGGFFGGRASFGSNGGRGGGRNGRGGGRSLRGGRASGRFFVGHRSSNHRLQRNRRI